MHRPLELDSLRQADEALNQQLVVRSVQRCAATRVYACRVATRHTFVHSLDVRQASATLAIASRSRAPPRAGDLRARMQPTYR